MFFVKKIKTPIYKSNLKRECCTKPSHLNNIMVKVYKQTTNTNRTIIGSKRSPMRQHTSVGESV